jgi:hypothetical protein
LVQIRRGNENKARGVKSKKKREKIVLNFMKPLNLRKIRPRVQRKHVLIKINNNLSFHRPSITSEENKTKLIILENKTSILINSCKLL